MSHPLLDDFVALDKEIKALSANLNKLKAKKKEFQEPIQELFTQLGVTSIKTTSGKTVKLSSRMWANARMDENGERDYASACEALAAAGHPEFVETRFNVVKVSSLMTELSAQDAIDPLLDEALVIGTVVTASVTA